MTATVTPLPCTGRAQVEATIRARLAHWTNGEWPITAITWDGPVAVVAVYTARDAYDVAVLVGDTLRPVPLNGGWVCRVDGVTCVVTVQLPDQPERGDAA